jgi:hypothetical protein
VISAIATFPVTLSTAAFIASALPRTMQLLCVLLRLSSTISARRDHECGSAKTVGDCKRDFAVSEINLQDAIAELKKHHVDVIVELGFAISIIQTAIADRHPFGDE